jgi:hypothetical protein
MTIRFLILILIGTTPFIGFSQCIDREKITYGGDWDFVRIFSIARLTALSMAEIHLLHGAFLTQWK